MNRKIALLNLTRIGDLLMTAPMIDQLKKSNPDAGIHLIVVEGFAAIAQGLAADRVITVDFNGLSTTAVKAFTGSETTSAGEAYGQFSNWIDALRAENYDAIYNITHTRISAVLASLIGGEVKAGIHLDGQGYRRIAGPWSRYWFAGNLNRGINPYHLVDLNVQMALSEGEERVRAAMRFDAENSEHEAAGALLKSKGVNPADSYVVLQVGASADDKRWEPEKFGAVAAELAKRGHHKAVFVGTPEEADWVESALAVAGENAISLAGETTLAVLAEVLRGAKLVISNDTGTMHLAQAVGTPVLAITLGSALSDETGPYGAGNVIVEPDIDCFPCDFKNPCAVPVCHERIPASLVADLAMGMLEGNVEEVLKKQQKRHQVVIWATEFDEQGWWRKRPLSPLRFKTSELVRTVYRHTLCSVFHAREVEVEAIARAIVQEWGEKYPEKSREDCLKALDGYPAILKDLLTGAEQALAVAETIDRHSAGGGQMLTLLAREGESLAQMDEELLKRGLECDLLKPAFTLFRFGLENLPVEGLAQQARATVQVHGELILFLRLLEGIFGILKADTTVERVIPGESEASEAGRSEVENTEPLRRTRAFGETLKILMPTSGYYLQAEVASALTSLGHKVVPLPFEDREDVISRLLTESLDADLLLTINHLGFDRDGELASLLHRIGMPYVSWFVDRPAFILLDHEVGPVEHAFIATWEGGSVGELQGYGFERVQWLPLATDDRRFRKNGRRSGEGALRFVANSMVQPTAEWLEKTGRNENDPLIQRAVEELLMRRMDPETAVEAALGEVGGSRPEAREEWLQLCSAAALMATREYRRNLTRSMQDLDLHLYGDEGWRTLAPSLPWHGGVGYPRELAEVYRGALHLNATSFQMPTAVNQRVFDIPSAGGVVITDAQSSIRELFDEDSECLLYSEVGEAVEQALWALKNEEKATKISNKAAERIEKEHTYVHRMQTLLASVRSQRASIAVPVDGGKG